MVYCEYVLSTLGPLVHELLIDGQMLNVDPVTAIDNIALI
ncbi:hypothetical protein NITLEN_20002 [Nitrospira lenta]|uniref:Uncharacterized protein n=1 Tax=Nitrospira lenta TaxID=1436998 RepID=A0A330L3L8_9BACT|nr:hypothetical protein NITLEN_20002 [Nitrospira lenta]